MIVFLYSDKNYEHQAKTCIKSLMHKITDDIKIVYYTIGFTSDFEFPNLYKVKYPFKPEYPRFNFYKAELSLFTMEMFPNEHYIFTDTDVLFSRRFHPDKVKHSRSYPKASYGPHEYPFIWSSHMEGEKEVRTHYDETKLMKYFNVPQRSQRYVWSCFYSFNPNCKDFFEEYMSICKNQYLHKQFNKHIQLSEYFPYADETAFNICLWKREATQNLGFAFVNTHLLRTVVLVEETTDRLDVRVGQNVDSSGADWEYIDDPTNVLLYHGFKEESDTHAALNYLLQTGV
jgi:hypothetical protein